MTIDQEKQHMSNAGSASTCWFVCRAFRGKRGGCNPPRDGESGFGFQIWHRGDARWMWASETDGQWSFLALGSPRGGVQRIVEMFHTHCSRTSGGLRYVISHNGRGSLGPASHRALR